MEIKWFTNIASQKDTKSLFSMNLSRHFSQSGQCFLLALRAVCPRSDESLRKEIRTSEMFKGTRIPVQKKEAYRSTKFVSSYQGPQVRW